MEGGRDANPAGGLTLAEAIERYSDPAGWRAYQQAAARVAEIVPARRSIPISSRTLHPGSAPPDTLALTIKRTIRERDRLRRDLSSAFIEDLRSGRLMALGYAAPLRPDSKPIPIKAELWRLLRPNFRHSSAEGEGLRFIQIRIYGSKPADQGRPDPAGEHRGFAQRPGPLTTIPEIKTELRRRAKAGQLEKNLSAQCRALAAWNNEKHPDRTYDWQSLRPALRDLYNGLTGRKK